MDRFDDKFNKEFSEADSAADLGRETIDDEYLDSLIEDHSQNRNKKTKGHKAKWITVTAVAAAAVIAFSAIGISASTSGDTDETVSLTTSAQATATSASVETVEADAESETAYLSLTDTSDMTDSTSSAQYVLTDVSDIVEEVLPSVVSITSRTLVENYYNSGYGSNGIGGGIWEYYFGGNNGYGNYGDSDGSQGGGESASSEEEQTEVESGIGSGTIIAQNSSELLILTSYHVVEDSSSLYVTFINDVSVDGYIKSADESSDIAIVAVPLEDIDDETLSSIKIATVSTEEAEVGEGTIVIGNALGYGTSVTTGIVSATNRTITVNGSELNVLQTDAAINSGNSGGCVLNSKGEIIGISEAKLTATSVEGMCYAIPIYDNLELIQSLLNSEGTISSDDNEQTGSGAYLGIRGRDVSSDIASAYEMPVGVYVAGTVQGSGAEAAGVQSGDIIVGIDDTVITTMSELQAVLATHSAGDTVSLVINRLQDGSYVSLTLEVTLTDMIY